MIKAFNLVTDEVLYFNDDALYGPEWAVAFGYCDEHNLLSTLFNHLHDDTFPEFFKTLPVTRGKRSIACGDWATCVGEAP